MFYYTLIIMIELVLLFFYTVKANVITLNLKDYYFSMPQVDFQFIEENVKQISFLNTYLPVTILSQFSQINENNMIENNTIVKLDLNYTCVLYKSSVKIGGQSINDYNLYLTYSAVWFREYGIALGYHIKNDSFSIVHTLYKRKLIEHLVFVFMNNAQTKNGKLFIGGIPNNLHLNLPYKGIIPIDESLPTWGFTLNSIAYDNKKHMLNLPCIISSVMKQSFISDELFLILSENIFNKEKECDKRYIDEGGAVDVFRCKHNLPFMNQSIDFIFDKVKITIKIGRLFDKKNISTFSTNNPKKKFHNFDGVILSSAFIDLFNFTVFDYENKRIELYSDNIPIQVSNEALRTISIIHCIICIFNIIYLIIIYKQFNISII